MNTQTNNNTHLESYSLLPETVLYCEYLLREYVVKLVNRDIPLPAKRKPHFTDVQKELSLSIWGNDLKPVLSSKSVFDKVLLNHLEYEFLTIIDDFQEDESENGSIAWDVSQRAIDEALPDSYYSDVERLLLDEAITNALYSTNIIQEVAIHVAAKVCGQWKRCDYPLNIKNPLFIVTGIRCNELNANTSLAHAKAPFVYYAIYKNNQIWIGVSINPLLKDENELEIQIREEIPQPRECSKLKIVELFDSPEHAVELQQKLLKVANMYSPILADFGLATRQELHDAWKTHMKLNVQETQRLLKSLLSASDT